jgi:hypothetical protein
MSTLGLLALGLLFGKLKNMSLVFLFNKLEGFHFDFVFYYLANYKRLVVDY